MSKQAVVLLAHGSRDPRWREPFERLSNQLEQRIKPTQIRLAYMEFCEPTLEDVVHNLTEDQFSKITVVPMFMAAGGHLAKDVPRLIENVKLKNPSLNIVTLGPIGEFPRVQEIMIEEINTKLKTDGDGFLK